MSLTERLAEIEAAPRGPRTGAYFDFDGTLIDGYSALPLMRERMRRLQIMPPEVVALMGVAAKGAFGRGSFDDLMTVGVQAMRGRTQDELDDLGETLARSALGGLLYPEALQVLEAHRRRDHRVVIASSALPFQIEPLARELGVEDILCTRPSVVDGTLVGTIDGDILWGPAKAKAVGDHARASKVDLKQSFAYANGVEDLDFLSRVGHPRVINPNPALEQIARERDWVVERFTAKGRPSVIAGVRTLGAYGGMASGFGIGLGLGLLNRSQADAVNLTVSIGSDLALALAGVSLAVHGEGNLWIRRPAVFIFNHQSWLDGLIAMRLVRQDVTGVAKAQVARQPGIGQFARLAGMAFVERDGRGDPRKALEPVVDKLREGISIAIAPEGTRSTTPRLGRFKKGAFHMARQAGVPVVPIVIRNAGELLWRGSRVIRSGTVDVIVHEPIDVAAWPAEQMAERVEGVRELFVDTLARWSDYAER